MTEDLRGGVSNDCTNAKKSSSPLQLRLSVTVPGRTPSLKIMSDQSAGASGWYSPSPVWDQLLHEDCMVAPHDEPDGHADSSSTAEAVDDVEVFKVAPLRVVGTPSQGGGPHHPRSRRINLNSE